ncbi:hypothetical protein CDD80_6522 [Ophiocordyceps camponoti-rufipedis]|uniref:Endosomal spry domain-containing protein n=1 Tax=Ophiocordyceps camponoti-rufipedis TaxID=2004952 RepID=A0A2C5YLU8_9HYPO|nr:hypothetical protein CDD80_6522 [Ophiocordyceps camponoti-rufipedis]
MAPFAGPGGWGSLTARSDDGGQHGGGHKPGHGVLDPHDINNVGFFVLFALIGVSFVVAGIWFFFWARNGGLYFKEGDWEDYKSTVLRRKGPNGTLLSGATPSTQLGGGSVYRDVADDGTETVSGITAGASDVVAREKRRQKQKRREQEKKKKGKQGGRHVRRNEGIVEDEMAEKTAEKELRSYRHEKPARVGGLNRQADGIEWDATASKDSESSPSSRIQGGIRKVYSTTTAPSSSSSAGTERVRAEARRLRDESRSRRDFSYQRSGPGAESLLEGSGDSSVGTKSYHHPMPELRERERERRRREREDRRERRAGGYRREGVVEEEEG